MDRIRIVLWVLLWTGLTDLYAQSKKELLENLARMESQVDQIKKSLLRLSEENADLRYQLENKEEEFQKVEIRYERCDVVRDSLEQSREDIRQLQEALYEARLTRAERTLPEMFKKPRYVVASSRIRERLSEVYYTHYLSRCIRFNNMQRLFTEDLILEFEENPVRKEFAGFLRHHYVPEMGKEEYGFQRVSGYYDQAEEFKLLHIVELDGQPVDVVIKFEEDRERYNEIIGSDQDMAQVHTHYGNIREFSFSRCR